MIFAVALLAGLFVSAGFSGHGFGIGPAAGRLAAGDAPIGGSRPLRHGSMVDGADLGAPGPM